MLSILNISETGPVYLLLTLGKFHLLISYQCMSKYLSQQPLQRPSRCPSTWLLPNHLKYKHITGKRLKYIIWKLNAVSKIKRTNVKGLDSELRELSSWMLLLVIWNHVDRSTCVLILAACLRIINYYKLVRNHGRVYYQIESIEKLINIKN